MANANAEEKLRAAKAEADGAKRRAQELASALLKLQADAMASALPDLEHPDPVVRVLALQHRAIEALVKDSSSLVLDETTPVGDACRRARQALAALAPSARPIDYADDYDDDVSEDKE